MPIMVESLPTLPRRPADGHKGTFGHALVLGGSRSMRGAICLAGVAALRGGTGLVTVGVPAEIAPGVAAFEPSYMTVPLPQDRLGRIRLSAREAVAPLLGRATALACGPGLGQSTSLRHFVEELFVSASLPAVFDADALNALAALPTGFPSRNPASRSEPVPARIITPHPGEFSRLLGVDTSVIQGDRLRWAAEFAAKHGVIVLLKGRETLITDGDRLAINHTGNNGMATGGSGDVLTGLIAALLARGLPAFDAARLGAHLHGLAGDVAAAELGPDALIASDLPRYFGAAFQSLSHET